MNNNYSLEPQIYVACLTAYNNGMLHGRWIDATQDNATIMQEIREMLKESPEPLAEEFAIHDYDDFGEVRIGEYASIQTVCAIAHFIQEHGETGAAVLDYYDDINEAKEAMENSYQGAWESEVDFATNLFDELYAHDMPESLSLYIDYEKFAQDLFMSDYFSIDLRGEVLVFAHC